MSTLGRFGSFPVVVKGGVVNLGFSHPGVNMYTASESKSRPFSRFPDPHRFAILRGGEVTVEWDTVASNCSTGNCFSNFNKRISWKSSNSEIWARRGFPTVSAPLPNYPRYAKPPLSFLEYRERGTHAGGNHAGGSTRTGGRPSFLSADQWIDAFRFCKPFSCKACPGITFIVLLYTRICLAWEGFTEKKASVHSARACWRTCTGCAAGEKQPSRVSLIYDIMILWYLLLLL